jgi:hypothetical protein
MNGPQRLIPCALCGEDAPEHATACPECGGDPAAGTATCGDCDGTGEAEIYDSPRREPWATHTGPCPHCEGGKVEAPFVFDRAVALREPWALKIQQQQIAAAIQPLPCGCGHSADRHEEEMPYPCHDCACDAYSDARLAAAKHADKADKVRQ